MAKIDKTYQQLLKDILSRGYEYNDPNRKGVKRKQLSDYRIKHDLIRDGFPILTLRKLHLDGGIGEFVSFMRGENNLVDLYKNKVNFWFKDGYNFSKKDISFDSYVEKIKNGDRLIGSLGKIYPWSMRNWNGEIDQIKNLVKTLKENPMATKKTVTMWNPSEMKDLALSACFTEDMLVNTNKGLVKISEITSGDKVLTKEGNYENVYAISKTPYEGTLIGFNKKGSNDLIKCTPNHKFYVKDKGWIQALDIEEGDFMSVPINKNSLIPNKEYYKKYNQNSGRIVKIDMSDVDLWWVMGYFLGDGYVLNNTNKISFSIADKECDLVIPRLKKIFPSLSNGEFKNNSGASKSYTVTNVEHASLFREFGHKAYNKFIPDFILDAPIEMLKEFIEGYKMADGTKTLEIYNFGTVSPSIAYGVQAILAKLGHPSSVSKSKRDLYKSIQGRKVKQQEYYYLISSYKNSRINHDSYIENGYLWQKVQNKYFFKDIKTDVYNMSVENSHSYTVFNTIVKNCHWSFEVLSEPLTLKQREEFFEGIDNEAFKSYKTEVPYKERENSLNDIGIPKYGLSIKWHQHSVDVYLGLPTNIIYYSLMCIALSTEVGMLPLSVIGDLSNVHLYDNAYKASYELLKRDPNKYNAPYFKYNGRLDDLKNSSFTIDEYDSYENIKVEMLAYAK